MKSTTVDRGVTVGDCRVELDARRVFVREAEVNLTPQEYALLDALVRNQDRALTREQLLHEAWGYTYGGDTRTVDVHIQKLRKKLDLAKEIQTVYKLGYRLSGRPENG